MDPWSEQIIAALEAVKPFVAHVSARTPGDDSVSFGTGLVIDHHHLITSAFVAGSNSEIEAGTVDGRSYRGTIVGIDPLYLLTIIKTDQRIEAGPPPLVPAAELQPGQLVLAVGNPFGEDHSVSVGVISSGDRTIYRPERFPVDGLIVTDARIHPGNHGGALATLDGRIAGINALSWVHSLGLAVQAETVGRVASQIIDYGRATHAYLGFSGESERIEQTIVDLLQLPMSRGVVVHYVARGGPGERAGIQEFDMVVAAGGKPVRSLGAIRRQLSRLRPGQHMPVTVFRGGELIDLTFPVEEMPRLWETPLPRGGDDDEDDDD